MKVVLANPRGFCAGVNRAISIVEKILKKYGTPIYVKHELVHNDYVVDQLFKKGVVFIENVNIVSDGSVLVVSAHGVSKEVLKEIKNRNLIMFDATCPLVATKVHIEVEKASRNNIEVIVIGRSGHPEIEGTMGYYVHLNFNRGIYLVKSEKDAWVL